MWGRVIAGLTILGAAGGALLVGRKASAASAAEGGNDAPPNLELNPLPTAGDVKGDLLANWGETPTDLRPLFVTMEEVSQIVGSARVFAIIAYRESRFITTAQNGNAQGEQDERDSSRQAYDNNKGRNPPLKYGEEAAAFGSGGLFGALAPYLLWTGVPEVGKKAPLLAQHPQIAFQPRVAAFAAVVMMERLLNNYRVDDIADIKVGWANPGLLGASRGSKTYNDVRTRFLSDAVTLGIDLEDGTIPSKLSAKLWPGVPAVFKALVGSLKEVTT